jgi:20S proteasome alpha/beta subunit
MYTHAHKKTISAPAVAQMLSNTLYYKRFFPYYTFNVLAGMDNEGAGAVWGYDAVGSFERVPYCVTGSGSALITSLLDNQVCEVSLQSTLLSRARVFSSFPSLTLACTQHCAQCIFITLTR